MSEHKLKPGKVVIERLSALGTAPGYFVRCEQPVLTNRHSPPMIDLAWKKDPQQSFPLMIFEVESSASNTITNNAIKVFSQANQDFEKPLFFFHVIVRAGRDSSRIEALRKQYGTNNYRLYRLDAGDATSLIRDILTQHRRLSSQFDVRSICKLLRDTWDNLDLNAILDHAESVSFETTFLEAYARLAVNDAWFLKRFLRRLSQLEEGNLLRGIAVKYETFLGESWHQPIHLAILARAERQAADQMLDQLRLWQEKSYYSTMIGPHFGMSRDYDDFILGVSAGLWSAVAAIFGSAAAKRYIAEQMHLICEQLENARDRFALYAAVWLLHVTASARYEVLFEYARNFINTRGGISPVCISDPPFVVPSFEELEKFEWDESVAAKRNRFIPPLKQFVPVSVPDVRSTVYTDAMRLGLGLLLEPESSGWFGKATVAILQSERG